MTNSAVQPQPMPLSKTQRTEGSASYNHPTKFSNHSDNTMQDVAQETSTLAKLEARRMRCQVMLETLVKYRRRHYGTPGIEEIETKVKGNMKNDTDPGDHKIVDMIMDKKIRDAKKSLRKAKREEN